MSRIRHLLTISPLAVTGLFLLACDSAHAPPQNTIETRATPAQSQENISAEYCGDTDALLNDVQTKASSPSGDYTVRILELPQPIPSNQIFVLSLEVVPTAGFSDQPLRVRADAGMPQHGHGLVVNPTVQRAHDQPGRFDVHGMMLHMSGAWEVYIDIFEGPYSERVTFHVRAQ